MNPNKARRKFSYILENVSLHLLYILVPIVSAIILVLILLTLVWIMYRRRNRRYLKKTPNLPDASLIQSNVRANYSTPTMSLANELSDIDNDWRSIGDNISEITYHDAKRSQRVFRRNSHLRKKYKSKVKSAKEQIKFSKKLGMKPFLHRYQFDPEVTDYNNPGSNDGQNNSEIVESGIIVDLSIESNEGDPWEMRDIDKPCQGSRTNNKYANKSSRKIYQDIVDVDVIPAKDIQIKNVIHTGTICHLITIKHKNGKCFLAKAIKGTATRTQQENADQEISKFINVDHPNFAKVLFTSFMSEYQRIYLYDKTEFGNLKLFLKMQKKNENANRFNLSTHDFIQMSLELCSAIEYLHDELDLVHADIAARNCLLNKTLHNKIQVQLTDACMSGILFPNDYQCLGDNKSNPVKWMSLESLIFHRYSKASDIWSFGVTMWELLVYAEQPYEDVDSFDMNIFLLEGQRLKRPHSCPSMLWNIIKSCWADDPEDRPSILKLRKDLFKFRIKIKDFI